MNVSDAVKVDANYRRWTKARTILHSLQKRWSWHRKNSLILPMHERRYAGHIQILREIKNTHPCEINTSLSSRQMMGKTAKEIMQYVFEGLKEPGPAQHGYFEATLAEAMNEKGKQMRAATQRFNLAMEVAYRAKDGWFMIFNTLTVRPDQYWNVFDNDSKAWSDYVRKLDRAVKKQCPHTDEYHSYFAAVEEGTQTGRLHIHVLHMVKALPEGCRDPNTGLTEPVKREIAKLKTERLWPHGFSAPIAVRTAPNDAYGLAGWRWPLDPKTKQGLRTQSAMKVAGYVGKYVTKTYASAKRSEYLWRVRKSRNLGRPIMELMTKRISTRSLARIASDPTINARMNGGKIPPNLLRIACLREWLSRSGSRSLNDMAKDIEPQQTLLQCFRDLTRGTRTLNQPSSTAMTTLGLDGEATYKTSVYELTNSCKAMDERYFPHAVQPDTAQSARPFIG